MLHRTTPHSASRHDNSYQRQRQIDLLHERQHDIIYTNRTSHPSVVLPCLKVCHTFLETGNTLDQTDTFPWNHWLNVTFSKVLQTFHIKLKLRRCLHYTQMTEYVQMRAQLCRVIRKHQSRCSRILFGLSKFKMSSHDSRWLVSNPSSSPGRPEFESSRMSLQLAIRIGLELSRCDSSKQNWETTIMRSHKSRWL